MYFLSTSGSAFPISDSIRSRSAGRSVPLESSRFALKSGSIRREQLKGHHRTSTFGEGLPSRGWSLTTYEFGQSATCANLADRTMRSVSSADRSFGLMMRVAKNWASMFPGLPECLTQLVVALDLLRQRANVAVSGAPVRLQLART